VADVGDVFDAGQEEFAALGPVLWNPLGEATVAAVRPRPGDRVLDVCCGAGASAIPTARAVGPEGHVDAVDLAERLLEQGRAGAKDLPQLEFVHADAAAWQGRDYDVVQCVYGIFFLPDMDASVDRLVSLLKPGGRFVVTTWAHGAITPVPEILGEAVAAEGGEPSEDVRGDSWRIDKPETLTEWLVARGLRDVQVAIKNYRTPLTEKTAWSIVMGSAMRVRLIGVAEEVLPRVRARFVDLLVTRKVEHMSAVSLIGIGRTA
jgi:SAM-dependent methyltransferase